MGRAPCCDKANVKKGPWSPEEDAMLKAYIERHGTGGNWIALPQKIGLKRCGKSCRLRWLNYLRPNIKHGGFSEEEDNIICNLYVSIGSRWSIIAAQLPGRTDNDIKNYWNTRLKKKLLTKQRKEFQEARLVKQEMMMMKRQNQADQNLNMFGETLMNQQQALYWPQLPQAPAALMNQQLDQPTYNYGRTPSSSHHHHQEHKPIIKNVNLEIKTEQGETTRTTHETNNISCQNPCDFSFSHDQKYGGFTMNSVMGSSTNSPLPSSRYNAVLGTIDQQEFLQWFGNFSAEAINDLFSNNIPDFDGLEINNTYYGNSGAIGTTSTSADQSTISWEDISSLVCPPTHQQNQIVTDQSKFSLEDANYFNGTIFQDQ